MSRPAPYAADTRAKGWRFELDYERIDQSDTWALASTLGAEARPFLLMQWLVAWRQTPCGSLPSDEAICAAMLGLNAKQWAKYRVVLMRGWWQADDGRMYHPALIERVKEMMQSRRSTADRKAMSRARVKTGADGSADGGDVTGNNPNVTRDSGVTPPGLRCESATGTGTSTSNTRNLVPPPRSREGVSETSAQQPKSLDSEPQGQGDTGADEPIGMQPTPAGAVCRAMRQAGIADVNPGHPRLRALLDAGAESAEFLGFAEQAVKTGRGFAWVLGAVEGERKRALQASTEIHHGPMASAQPWHETRSGIIAKALELGMPGWTEADWAAGNAPLFSTYARSVYAKAGYSREVSA